MSTNCALIHRNFSLFSAVFSLALGCAETTPANNDCPSNVQNMSPATGSNNNNGNNNNGNNGNNKPPSGDGDGNHTGDGDKSGDGDHSTGDGDGGGSVGHGDGDHTVTDGSVGEVDGGGSMSGDGDNSNPHKPVEGTGGECSSTADTRNSGGCYGFYCGTNKGDLRAAISNDAACGSDKEVAATCDGEPARVVSKCARDSALNINPTDATRTCARGKDTLSDISDACLECYVQSAKCARDNCLTQCLAGDSAGCDKCREDNKCTPNFYDCAGLPNPQ